MVKRHPTTAAELVTRAAAIVQAEGFGALSVRRLASEVDASRQVVYTHFGGMDGLLDALHMYASDLLAHDMAALTEPPGTDDNLRAAAHAYVRGARQRPELFDLTFGRPLPHFTPSTTATTHGRGIFRDHIVRLIDAWLSSVSPDHTQDQARTFARLFWASVHGLVTIEQAGHASRSDTDRLVDQTVTLLLAGWQTSQD